MTDLADLSITSARKLLDSGDVSSSDLLEAVLKRAGITESHLHAYLTIDKRGAQEAAVRADERIAAGDGARFS